MHCLILFADSEQETAAAIQQVAELIAEPVSSGGSPLILLLTIFVLAVFVGAEIISKIPPTLHTPLMSGSNAISGITLVGAILAGGSGSGTLAAVLGVSAVILATVNVVGGFVVTNRMLAMFRSKK
jgi:H+-translocating NAD(P) transhydrogenase subunit alpha